MPNKPALRARPTRLFILRCLLGSLGLVSGCVADSELAPPPALYGSSGPVYGPEDPYYGDPYWGAWGGGYYGGFYGRGFGGTRAYHGTGHGARASRGGGFHGAAGGGHRGR